MRSRLLERVKRLEQVRELAMPAVIQYGWLKPLPEDHVGPRHVVIVNREPVSPGFEWCQFEERPGLARPGETDDGVTD